MVQLSHENCFFPPSSPLFLPPFLRPLRPFLPPRALLRLVRRVPHPDLFLRGSPVVPAPVRDPPLGRRRDARRVCRRHRVGGFLRRLRVRRLARATFAPLRRRAARISAPVSAPEDAVPEDAAPAREDGFSAWSAANTWFVTAATGSRRNASWRNTARMRFVSASTSFAPSFVRRGNAEVDFAPLARTPISPSVASRVAKSRDAEERPLPPRRCFPGDFFSLLAVATRIFSRNAARFFTLRFWCDGSAARTWSEDRTFANEGGRDASERGERAEERDTDRSHHHESKGTCVGAHLVDVLRVAAVRRLGGLLGVGLLPGRHLPAHALLHHPGRRSRRAAESAWAAGGGRRVGW